MSGLAASPERDERLREAAEVTADFIRALIPGMVRSREAMTFLAQNETASITLIPPDVVLEKAGVSPFTFVLRFFVQESGVVAYYNPNNGSLGVGLLPQGVRLLASNPNMWPALGHHMLRVLDERHDVVVHEATHMLDYERAKTLPKSLNVRTRREYHNKPQEFNAHFQHIVSATLRKLERLPRAERESIFASFEHFEELLEEHEDYKVVMHYLDERNERAMRARLWQTWEYIRQKAAK